MPAEMTGLASLLCEAAGGLRLGAGCCPGGDDSRPLRMFPVGQRTVGPPEGELWVFQKFSFSLSFCLGTF